jgi:type II secretory pathway component PulF
MGVLTVAIMMTMVVPQLKSVFSTIGQSLPWTTELLLGISDFIRVYWYLVLISIVFILIIGRGLIIIEKTAFDEIKLNLPMIGNFIKKSELGKFCGTLGLLINTGIPILAAMEITIPTLSNLVLQKELKKVADGLKGGTSFASGLKQSGRKYFTPFMVNLVAVGEEGGRLDDTLAEIANSYERDTEEAIKIGLSLVEPVLILGMGLVVGFIVISMLLPIFTMGTMMQ